MNQVVQRVIGLISISIFLIVGKFDRLRNYKTRLERLIWIVWPRLGRNLTLNIKIRWRRRRLLLIRYVEARLGREAVESRSPELRDGRVGTWTWLISSGQELVEN
jgi:hypothetical protein